MKKYLGVLLLACLLPLVFLSGCVASLAAVIGLPELASQVDNSTSEGNSKADNSKNGFLLEGTTTMGSNWNNVSVKNSDSFPSNRIKYQPRLSKEIGVGYQDKDNFQYTLNATKSEYNVKVDSNDDFVTERGVLFHRSYIFNNDFAGVNPFVRVGWGMVWQKYDKTEFPDDYWLEGGIQKGVRMPNKLEHPCFDLTIGGTKGFFDDNLRLKFGAQWLRWGINMNIADGDTFFGLDPLFYGGINQYNLLLSLSYRF